MKVEVLENLIENFDQYEAHILKNENGKVIQRETLKEHTALTLEYFHIMWEEKGIEEIFQNFSRKIDGGISEEGRAFWKKAIWGIPLFHDAGKINPEFQNRQMKNNKVKNNRAFANRVSVKHSMISAVMYLDYFCKKLKEEVQETEERRKLRYFLVLHSFLLARHHSDLIAMDKYLEELTEGEGRYIFDVFMDGKCDEYREKIQWSTGDARKIKRKYREWKERLAKQEVMDVYIYGKLLYSLLAASDYYATAQFMSGMRMQQWGNIQDIEKWITIYENTNLMKEIRKYEKEQYPQTIKALREEKDINVLRKEMFLDAERVLKESKGQNLFYLEAPTGSGKSNTAMNLSFTLIKEDRRIKKIYYIYPFNTLVEQNRENLEKIFGEEKFFEDIVVVNSLTPIKLSKKEKEKEEKSENTLYYQRALLDRQFLNYPIILSTHVSLFDVMFGDTRESVFGFHQLTNSVVVLDEIQSYKNTLWGEIIYFLREFAEILNMKIIIMSATLPNLDLLTDNAIPAIRLIKDIHKYFSNPCFMHRVEISKELLNVTNPEDRLLEHVKKSAEQRKKILVEFIKKESAFRFFQRLTEDEDIICEVEYMSGDDNLAERARILRKIKNTDEDIILVATQVVEAGIDIDMDIGYKNISKMDSEEQFAGRINRSSLKNGKIYFFRVDDGREIYKGDIRIQEEFTLQSEEIYELFEKKDFQTYYEKVLKVLREVRNENKGDIGLDQFFNDTARLDWHAVKTRMQLIPEDKWSMSVYLARALKDENENMIDGREVWKKYVDLLQDFSMDYSEKKIKLSEITSKMNYFLYQIKKNGDLVYNDKVGEIFYIEDGEKYFVDGKLDRKKLQGEIGEFVDFI